MSSVIDLTGAPNLITVFSQWSAFLLGVIFVWVLIKSWSVSKGNSIFRLDVKGELVSF